MPQAFGFVPEPEPRKFQISVKLSNEELTVVPAKAIVRLGTEIRWIFTAVDDTRDVKFDLYFAHGTPLPWTERTTIAKHDGPTNMVIGGRAQTDGDYKYGIRASDATSGNQLADDDPYLVVLPA